MTPLSNTLYSLALFLALVALKHWSKRCRRELRELPSEALQPRSARSAASQSSAGEPPSRPRASQYE